MADNIHNPEVCALEKLNITNRLATLEGKVEMIESKQARFDVRMVGIETTLEYIRQSIDEVKCKFESMNDDPKSMLEHIKKTAVSATITAIVTSSVLGILWSIQQAQQ